ncbi:CheR family methyltransferase [Chelatococcus sp. GCM10030263]|uniref:CheR family methyltransferase n=1 Tax=Chelatococcus sp. GCM10030263 TaxID=3273387 RepID=UPI0036070FB7
MTEADYQFLCAFLQARCGIALPHDGHYLADSRLAAVCQRHGLPDLSAIIGVLRRGGAPEVERGVLEAMATHETFFFRDKPAFEQIRTTVLPQLIASRAASRRLRIWCAAASTGQEAFSLAMLLDGMAPRLSGWDIRILATDMSLSALERARGGLYTHFEVQRGLPIHLLLKYFEQAGDLWQIDSELRAMVAFEPVNLIDDFASLGIFDLILCRNVLIYFDEVTKRDVLERIADRLAHDGRLILGGVETPVGLTEEIVADEALRGVYRRNAHRHLAVEPLGAML